MNNRYVSNYDNLANKAAINDYSNKSLDKDTNHNVIENKPLNDPNEDLIRKIHSEKEITFNKLPGK